MMTPRVTGHELRVLREYMQDLVEQAKQEEQAHAAFGFAPQSYRPDQAISDLLAILDDRIESEGVQVGLPQEFLHRMWTLCNEASATVVGDVWLRNSLNELSGASATRSRTRELTYRALVTYLEPGDDATS
ncbi:MAG: hypothetical protein U0172_12780 [Nitrospiraceae bacterium]